MFSAKDLFFTASGKYQVNNSLRFRSSASAYLNRTFSTPTSQNIWTYSCWVKRGSLGGNYNFGPSPTGINSQILFGSTDTLDFYYSAAYVFQTTQVFRDPSAWYHIVLAFNGAASGSNKVLLYVNGVQVTAFSTDNRSTFTTSILNTAIVHGLGRYQNAGANYLDGYLAEVNFIDGQALTPSSFGTNDPTTGVWVASRYTGTYGTNGFYLPFSDTSALTTSSNAGLGKDFSGNSNYWTTNNISITSGVTYDAMIDAPNIYAYSATQGVGNYCVLNSLSKVTTSVLTDANLSTTSVAAQIAIGSIGLTSGKWYWEITFSAATSTQKVGVYGTSATSATVAATTNTIGVRFDAGAGTADYTTDGTNYTSIGTGLTSGPYFPYIESATNAKIIYANFGQRPFSYTPPSGYSSVNTSNLPTPTITNGAQYMAAVTYQGATAPNTVTTTSSNSGNNPLGVSFQPDLVWIKSRSAATDHKWTDSVRGATKALISNTTGAETTDTNGLTAFTASGFTVGSDTTYNNTTGPATYVAWEWSKGASQGFDIVTYTGNGANRTISHSLGVIPSMMIVKQRTASSTTNWAVYHSSLANTEYLLLNTTAAKATGATYWNSTTPTASVFSLGTAADVNTNTGTYVNWLFAPVASYSSFGNYTANNSPTDGPFIFTGFRPRFVLIKRYDTSSTNNWVFYDTSRNTYNETNLELWPNSSNGGLTYEATASNVPIDILSNGFKIRSNGADVNGTAGTATYIYAAFAENPFKYSNAR